MKWIKINESSSVIDAYIERKIGHEVGIRRKILIGRFRIPEAKRIDDLVLITDDRNIVRYGLDGIGVYRAPADIAFFIAVRLRISVEAYGDGIVRLTDFPRETIQKPGIRIFDLLAVLDLLAEETVFVTDGVAMPR